MAGVLPSCLATFSIAATTLRCVALRFAVIFLEFRIEQSRKHRRCPCPEILGGEILPGDVLDVGVDIAGVDCARLAFLRNDGGGFGCLDGKLFIERGLAEYALSFWLAQSKRGLANKHIKNTFAARRSARCSGRPTGDFPPIAHGVASAVPGCCRARFQA